ncbi:MAG: hypothetical protein PHD97_08625 [Bacteroidales bacterium]|nr:hypothetical protein [Bacteroidales bacterium]
MEKENKYSAALQFIEDFIAMRKEVKEIRQSQQEQMKFNAKIEDYLVGAYLDDIIKESDARKMIGVGTTKWNELKKSGKIAFSQDGRKTRLLRKDILQYINNTRITAQDYSINPRIK